MTAPFFSLFISQRNAGAKILRCIESVQAQTFTDFEVWCVDDHSDREPYEMLCASFPEDDNWGLRLNLTERKYKLRNYLDTNFRGDIIVELDGDDRLIHSDALAILREIYQDPNVDATCGQHRNTDGQETTPVTYPARGHRMSGLHFAAAHPAPRTWRRSLTANIPRRAYLDPDTGRPYRCTADAAMFIPAYVHANIVVSVPALLLEVDRQGPYHDYIEDPEGQAEACRKILAYWGAYELERKWD